MSANPYTGEQIARAYRDHKPPVDSSTLPPSSPISIPMSSPLDSSAKPTILSPSPHPHVSTDNDDLHDHPFGDPNDKPLAERHDDLDITSTPPSDSHTSTDPVSLPPLLPRPRRLRVHPDRDNRLAAHLFHKILDGDEEDTREGEVRSSSSEIKVVIKEEQQGNSSSPTFPGSIYFSIPNTQTDSDPKAGTSSDPCPGEIVTTRAPLLLPALGGGRFRSHRREPTHSFKDTYGLPSESCDLPVWKQGEEEVIGKACLDPGVCLPPLAAEHPGRVWNSRIHSIEPDLQPLVRWTFGTLEHENEGYFIAHMSLTLPPTHPLMAPHVHRFPQDRHTVEYIAAAEEYGGTRRWTGEPRRLKTAHISMREKVDAQNSTLVKCMSDGALSWVIPSTTTEEITEAAAVEGARTPPVPPTQPFPSYSSSLDAQPPSQRRDGRSLQSGPTASNSSRPIKRQRNENIKEEHEKEPTEVDPGGTTDRVDWQAQLAAFCQFSTLPSPKYTQNIDHVSPGHALFTASVSIEEEVFVASQQFPTIREARQDLARSVLVEHFGQLPVPLDRQGFD